MAPTIVQTFWERVQRQPEKLALRSRGPGGWRDISWREYGDNVRRVAGGLLSLGLERSDRMSLLARNRPEWLFSDTACMSLGGITAPIYTTSSPEQVAYVIRHSGSKVAVVEDDDQLDKILKMRSELPELEKVVVIEGERSDAHRDLVIGWNELLARGDAAESWEVDDRRGRVEPGDVATFVYTSGTTGTPRAVMLSHANIQWTCEALDRHLLLREMGPLRVLSYLPLSHIAERMVSHLLQIHLCIETWFAQSLDSLLDDLKECRPTCFFAVPRVWEKFHAGVQARMEEADPNARKTKLAKKAIEIGRRITEAEQDAVAAGGKMRDRKVPVGVKLQHAVLDKLVLHKVRAAFGLQECGQPLSAGAPLDPELTSFFHSVGLKIAEGYGQSEDNGPTTWNPRDAIKIGTVGLPLSGLEVKLAEDGEVLVRGGNVMLGYYKDEKATAETLDEDGWLHSGDIGKVDDDGYLTITDRKKDVIITAGAKNIAPQEIESRIKRHPLVSQVVVIGDRRPFLTALITLDEEQAQAWAKKQGIDGDTAAIAHDERTLGEIQSAIDEANERVARVEGIRKFRVLERDFLQEEEEMTPTLKVRRKQIAETYADVIEQLYRKDSPQAAGARAPLRK